MKPIIAFTGRIVTMATLMAAGRAVAADLPSRTAPLIVPAPIAFSWHGFYVGAYAGALLGDGTFGYFQNTPLRGSGFLGGGAIGYNWQWTPAIVLGLEADFGYRGQIQGERVTWVYPGPTDSGVFGTARARLGYAFAPRWLAYATAGFAYGTDFAPHGFTSSIPLTFGQQNTGTTVRAGWTAGGGVEYAWSDQISVKAEYLYARLADSGVAYSTNFGPISLDVRSAGHVVRGGLNYHFITGAPSAAVVVTK